MLLPPMNDVVRWDPGERIIGVVGVAPAATADFYRKLVVMTPAKKDWEHVRVIIDSNPKIPSRGRYFELGETDPSPYIRQSMLDLYRAGATVMAVPCNTAHILYARYTVNLPGVDVPNMVQCTADALLKAATSLPRSTVVFASRLTMEHELYRHVLARHGVTTLDVSATQGEVSALIEAVKQGQNLDVCRKRMLHVLSRYPNADSVILGCTEISLLLDQSDCTYPLVDSNVALAQACLALARNESAAGPRSSS